MSRKPVVISQRPTALRCQRCGKVHPKHQEGSLFGLDFASDSHCVSCFSWILQTEGMAHGIYPDPLTLKSPLTDVEARAQFARVLEARRQTERFNQRSATWR